MNFLPDSLLVLDKPGGLTSRAAVDRVLHWFPRRTRIGHTGTLDPLATGVLVLCLGGATRLTEYVQLMRKTYHARLLLGARSDTDDADGSVTAVPGAIAPAAATVMTCVADFVGTIAQVPPAFSAAKVTGRRAYDLARSGQEVELRPRPVVIHRIDVLRYEYPCLELQIHCGKGTYIRSLARDLGERLGCGALVQSLRRTQVGPFTVERAISLEMDAATVSEHLLPIELAVAELPRLVLPEMDLKRLRQGQKIALTDVPDPMEKGREVAVFDSADHLIAVGMLDAVGKQLRPMKVL